MQSTVTLKNTADKRSRDTSANSLDTTMIEKLLTVLKDINSWQKVARFAAIATICILSYYAYVQINQKQKFSEMNPYEYFAKQEVRDAESVQQLLNEAKEELGCESVAAFLYQPKEHYFFRQLLTISPVSEYTDYEKSEEHMPLYNLHRLLTDLNDGGMSVITMMSGHHDSKFLVAQKLEVSYVMPIHVKGMDIGHVSFSFKTKPDVIPLTEMKSITERLLLKIF